MSNSSIFQSVQEKIKNFSTQLFQDVSKQKDHQENLALRNSTVFSVELLGDVREQGGITSFEILDEVVLLMYVYTMKFLRDTVSEGLFTDKEYKGLRKIAKKTTLLSDPSTRIENLTERILHLTFPAV